MSGSRPPVMTCKSDLSSKLFLLCAVFYTVSRTPVAVESPFCNTVSPGGGGQNTFPRQLQTNFESFPNNCCTSRDCRLTGYRIYWNISRNFFLIHHLKNGGSSYNRAQSSKKRTNVFVISNTVKICLGWVVQLFRCDIFFVLLRYLIYGNIRE
jgi:hypothetical protein